METGVLNERQRATLRSWSFTEHLGLRMGYYTRMVSLVEATIRKVHVYSATPPDYVSILEPYPQDDPMLNKYIDSIGWIPDDIRPLFVIMFTRLLVSVIVEGVVPEVEERA
jgi:hypothetical protein